MGLEDVAGVIEREEPTKLITEMFVQMYRFDPVPHHVLVELLMDPECHAGRDLTPEENVECLAEVCAVLIARCASQ